MKVFTKLISIALISLLHIPLASAAKFPSVISYGDDVQGYLDNYGYFNGYKELKAIDFEGKWQFTAIARESGHTNTVSLTKDGAASFTTSNYNNWGQWNDVDFDSEQLYFEDGNPKDIALDPFASFGNYFRVFELTEASNLLSYLATPIKLEAGTIIVGFNDNGTYNGLPGGDGDFDDIVVAMKSVSPVPVPAAVWLFGTALLGLIGIHRRKRAMA